MTSLFSLSSRSFILRSIASIDSSTTFGTGKIVMDAGCEAAIHLSDPMIAKAVFPLIMESLDLQYGKDIFHALQTVLEFGINAEMKDELRQFEKRFDGAPEKEQVLDLWELSEESQQLSILANQLSAVMKNLYCRQIFTT